MGTVLSENQQRLQGRERELKDMKKVLDTLTVNIYHIQGKENLLVLWLASHTIMISKGKVHPQMKDFS